MLPTLSIKNHEIDEHFFLREINFALFISSGYFDFRGSKFLNLTIFEIVKSVVEVHSIVRKSDMSPITVKCEGQCLCN